MSLLPVALFGLPLGCGSNISNSVFSLVTVAIPGGGKGAFANGTPCGTGGMANGLGAFAIVSGGNGMCAGSTVIAGAPWSTSCPSSFSCPQLAIAAQFGIH